MLTYAETNDYTELYLYGPVGSDWDGFTDSDVVNILTLADPEKPLHARINSEGGSVFDGYAIYNLLRHDPREVVVTVDGVALSAASFIALAGNTVRTARESLWMIHNPWGLAMGDHAEMSRMATLLSTVRDQIAAIYARAGSEDLLAYKNLMAAETWLTAEMAQEHGFAGEIIDEPAKMRDYVLTGFKNVPAKIKAHYAPAPKKLEQAIATRLKVLEIDDLLTKPRQPV